jgi:hypothetical protein
MALALITLAFILPAIAPTLPVAKTDIGLFLALLALAMLIIRAMMTGYDDISWPVALEIPISIIAGSTALAASPDDSARDVIWWIGAIAVPVSAGFAGALIAKRPRGWGTFSRRDLIITLALIIGLVGWNQLYQFPQAQGMALMSVLVGVALVWNFPAFGKAARHGLPQRAAWAHRSLDASSTVIIMSYMFAPVWFFHSTYDLRLALITAFAIFAAMLVMRRVEDMAEDRAA